MNLNGTRIVLHNMAFYFRLFRRYNPRNGMAGSTCQGMFRTALRLRGMTYPQRGKSARKAGGDEFK